VNVLVVGGSGLMGSAVCAELTRAGHEVTVLSRHRPAPDRPQEGGPAGACGAGAGEWVAGDVRLPGLGLTAAAAARLRGRVTHVVSCAGSVALDTGPRAALDVHLRGTENVLAFARACPRLRCVLHVSSVLVFGRCPHPVGNGDLDVGQRFRNWYEFGKFAAERAVRDAPDVPVCVLRLGPLLGVDGPVRPRSGLGVLSALPHVLAGRTLPLVRCGRFPSYAGDVTAAAQVVRRLLERAEPGRTWTWFDPRRPSLAAVLAALCAPWGVVPRIVDAPALVGLARLAAPVLGVPRQVCDYLAPWVVLAPDVLADLPFAPPSCPDRYLERTGRMLREHGSALAGG
jgi:nucleoside-diphosphate-sugar epimerase